jgi:hypothetical protein
MYEYITLASVHPTLVGTGTDVRIRELNPVDVFVSILALRVRHDRNGRLPQYRRPRAPVNGRTPARYGAVAFNDEIISIHSILEFKIRKPEHRGRLRY